MRELMRLMVGLVAVMGGCAGMHHQDEAGMVLRGWHQLGQGEWSNEDGVIVGKHSAADKEYGHLVSDHVYGDFKASLEFDCVKGNSGFYFHSEPEGLQMHGVQAEIDEKKNVGGLYESYGRQWVIPPPGAGELAKFFRPGDWNKMVVEVKGDHVQVWVNGFKTADVVDEKGRKEGVFALQLHVGDGEVRFRKIRIEGKALK